LGEQILRFICNIPDLDTGISGSGQPLVGSVEVNGIDDGFTLVLHVWLFKIMVLPHFDDLVLTTGGNVQTVSGDIQGIDIGIVSFDGGDVLEDTVPDFKSSVPTNGSIVLSLGGLGESDS